MQDNKNDNIEQNERELPVSADTEAEEVTASDTSEAVEEEKDVLDAFSLSETEEGGKEKKPKAKKAGLLKKQIILGSIILGLVAVLLPLYFFLFKPMFDDITAEEPETPEPMIEGEIRDSGGYAILMYPQVERVNMKSVTVKNTFGGYTMRREQVNDSESDFLIEEHPNAPLDAETISTISVATGYPVIMSRLHDNSFPAEELSKYGLGEGDDYSTVTVESLDGIKYTYYVGNLITSGGGYYARCSDRNAVYVINADSGKMIKSAATSVLSPLIGYPIGGDNAKTLDLFALSKNGEDFITFSYDVDSSLENADSKSIYKMSFPGEYIIDSDKVANDVTTTLATLKGQIVVAAGDGTDEGRLIKNEALMAQYGFHDLNNPLYELFYESGEFVSYVIFAESGYDGYYNAYSYLWDTIVFIPASSVPYLAWSLLDFVDDNIFSEEIGKVEYVQVSGNIEYKGTAYAISEKMFYKKNEDGTLTCRAESTGLTYKGNTSQVNGIQAFYISALMMTQEGYASEAGFDKAEAEKYAEMVVKMNDGEILKYDFYRFGGLCYYELNGVGEFYVFTKQVNKVLVDAVRAANGESVDWSEEYPVYPNI